MNSHLQFASLLAQKAGNLLLKLFKSKKTRANFKSDNTIVTEADLASDNLIQSSIQENYPDDGILSEEGSTVYPADKTHVWVIDPLDGTTNFSLGLHYWGVSIARLKDGKPEIAALYFPLLDELFTASLGGGACLNEAKLNAVSSIKPLYAAFFSMCSRTQKEYHVLSKHKTRILGSAAYGLCTVAKGSAVLAFEVVPKVWDFSGSWLVNEETGGTMAPLFGDNPYPLQYNTDYAERSFPMLAASTKEKWELGKSQLQTKTNS